MEEARVEGLLALLRDGLSPSIREHAARQLGLVVTPESLPGFLVEIRPLVRHSSWDTRVAAAQAVGAIATSLCPDIVESCAIFAQAGSDSLLQLSQLDMDQLLSHAKPLLRSGGEEYNYETNFSCPADHQKHLVRQRYLLWKRISQDVQTSVSVPRPVLQQSTGTFLESADVATSPGLAAATHSTTDVSALLATRSNGPSDQPFRSAESKSTDAAMLLAALVQDCLEAMFDAQWEVRQGAVAVLRQVFVQNNTSPTVNVAPPAVRWIEEVVVRCVCVLALEQYVDYSADGSIAPIRHLVAQVTGRFLPVLSSEVSTVLVRLLRSTHSWHACHGALLAIHFVREPTIETKDRLLGHVVHALFRTEDEVFGAAAQCLVALTLEQTQVAPNVLDRLWALLTAEGAATSVELAYAYVLNALQHVNQSPTLKQVEVVSTFLSHSLVPVREAAISWLSEALCHMAFDDTAGIWWLSLVWSRVLVDGPCQEPLQRVWSQALAIPGLLPATSLLSIAQPATLTLWLHAAWAINSPTLTYTDLSNSLVQVKLPAINDTSRAMVATQCLADLHAKTWTAANAWSAWVCDALRSSRGEEIVAIIALLSMTARSESWPTPPVAEAVATALQRPRTTFYAEQTSGWELLTRQVTQMAVWFPSELKQQLVAVTTPSSTHSWQLAQAVAALPYESLAKPEPYTQAQHLRQDVFGTEERVRLSFDALQATIGALFATAFLRWQLPWDKPAFLVRPLMEGIKLSADKRLQRHFADTVVGFLLAFTASHSACCMKMVGNLAANLSATPTTSSRFRGAELALSELVRSIPHPTEEDSVHAKLWTKLSALWAPPHVPLLSAVLAHANPSLLRPVLTQAWPWLTEHPTLAPAIATAASRCPSLMAHVMELLQDKYCSAVVESLVQQYPSACVPVVCDLIPLELADIRGSTLSSLIPLLPLHGHLETASPFLFQLQTGHVPPLPASISWPSQLTLRPYQVEGIQWLYFLASHRLHGVLADDMGLGKTLQVLCSIVARKRTGSLSNADGLTQQRPTPFTVLVVCPPIVMAHWVREVATYFPDDFASVVSYAGTASQRHALRRQMTAKSGGRDESTLADNTLVVTSYATLNHDRQFFHGVSFTYCVADEVHLCRNPATATAQALFGVRATHRVAMSGTPVQNSAVDIWSVFAFLLPQYLGDATSFRQSTSGPILSSRKATATPAQKEAGAMALTGLHAKIAPFVLRRTKEAVLRDLPAKSIQDVPCSLTPLQRQLYDAADSLDTAFATCRQRQQVCIHPKLVDAAVYADEASGKMTALLDLMRLIHDDEEDNAGDEPTRQRDRHRSLIFCHTPANAALIQAMLATHLPHLRTSKLDGSVPMSQRAAVVDEFNRDMSIQSMVLTTSIGGLGLNLVSADTVVFVEHSWNPFVDLQAMDRVHRLGQVKAVTVYRLLAQHTIEDEILTAQRFKQATADAVLGPNETKGGTNVLSVLQSGLAHSDPRRPKKKPKTCQTEMGTLLDELGDLWDVAQYDSLDAS